MPPEQIQFTGEGDTSSRARSRGFTLIELLVVIAIIGLLSSIVLASLNTARSKANDAKRVADLRSVQTALELYASDHNGLYPVSGTGGGWASQCSAWGGLAANAVIPGLVPTYLPSMPADPQMNTGGNSCCYLYAAGNADYKFMAHNCPTSTACMAPGSATSGFTDPARTWSCAVYTPGVYNW